MPIEIDIKTLALMVALGNFTFGLLATLYNFTSEAHSPSLKTYQWAKFAGSLGIFLLFLRGNSQIFLTQNLAHCFMFLGWGLEFAAYCVFLKKFRWQRFIFIALASIIAVFQILYWTGNAYLDVMKSLVGGLIFGAMSWTFLYQRQKNVLLLFLGMIDLGGSGLFFLRTAERLLFLENLPTLSQTFINSLLYVDGFFAMICHGFGFLLLVKQEDEKRLKTAFVELQQAEADQRQLLAMATHEFRTPLSVIDSSAQLLAVTLPSDAQTQKMLERIRRGVKRLVHFLDNCLTEDRLDNRALILHADKVNLVQLATWGVENAGLISSSHKIRLDLAPRLPVIEGDKHLLQVLLINLLSNAIKFSKPETEIFLRMQIANEKVLLSVCDEGQGIPADELPHVSEKYMRGRGAGTISGAGLGLSLVVRIVELHHGHFSISSTLGKGTTVKIELLSKLPLKPKAQ